MNTSDPSVRLTLEYPRNMEDPPITGYIDTYYRVYTKSVCRNHLLRLQQLYLLCMFPSIGSHFFNSNISATCYIVNLFTSTPFRVQPPILWCHRSQLSNIYTRRPPSLSSPDPKQRTSFRSHFCAFI